MKEFHGGKEVTLNPQLYYGKSEELSQFLVTVYQIARHVQVIC